MKISHTLDSLCEFDDECERPQDINFCESVPRQHNFSTYAPLSIAEPMFVPRCTFPDQDNIQGNTRGGQTQVRDDGEMVNSIPGPAQPLHQLLFPSFDERYGLAASAAYGQLPSECGSISHTPAAKFPVDLEHAAQPKSISTPGFLTIGSSTYYDPVFGGSVDACQFPPAAPAVSNSQSFATTQAPACQSSSALIHSPRVQPAPAQVPSYTSINEVLSGQVLSQETMSKTLNPIAATPPTPVQIPRLATPYASYMPPLGLSGASIGATSSETQSLRQPWAVQPQPLGLPFLPLGNYSRFDAISTDSTSLQPYNFRSNLLDTNKSQFTPFKMTDEAISEHGSSLRYISAREITSLGQMNNEIKPKHDLASSGISHKDAYMPIPSYANSTHHGSAPIANEPAITSHTPGGVAQQICLSGGVIDHGPAWVSVPSSRWDGGWEYKSATALGGNYSSPSIPGGEFNAAPAPETLNSKPKTARFDDAKQPWSHQIPESSPVSMGDFVGSLQSLLIIADKLNGYPIDDLVKSIVCEQFVENLFSASNPGRNESSSSGFDIISCVRQGFNGGKNHKAMTLADRIDGLDSQQNKSVAVSIAQPDSGYTGVSWPVGAYENYARGLGSASDHERLSLIEQVPCPTVKPLNVDKNWRSGVGMQAAPRDYPKSKIGLSRGLKNFMERERLNSKIRRNKSKAPVDMQDTIDKAHKRDISPTVESAYPSPVLKYIDPLGSPKVKAKLAKASQEVADLKAEKALVVENLEFSESKGKRLSELTSEQYQQPFLELMEVNILKRKIAEMNKERKNLSVTTLAKLADSLEDKLKASDIQLSEFTRVNADLIEENDELRERNKELATLLDASECMLKESNIKISDLTSTNENLSKNNDTLVQAKKALDALVEFQEVLLKDSNNEIVAKSEGDRKLLHDKQALEALVEALENVLKNTDKQINELKTQFEFLSRREELDIPAKSSLNQFHPSIDTWTTNMPALGASSPPQASRRQRSSMKYEPTGELDEKVIRNGFELEASDGTPTSESGDENTSATPLQHEVQPIHPHETIVAMSQDTPRLRRVTVHDLTSSHIHSDESDDILASNVYNSLDAAMVAELNRGLLI